MRLPFRHVGDCPEGQSQKDNTVQQGKSKAPTPGEGLTPGPQTIPRRGRGNSVSLWGRDVEGFLPVDTRFTHLKDLFCVGQRWVTL